MSAPSTLRAECKANGKDLAGLFAALPPFAGHRRVLPPYLPQAPVGVELPKGGRPSLVAWMLPNLRSPELWWEETGEVGSERHRSQNGLQALAGTTFILLPWSLMLGVT